MRSKLKSINKPRWFQWPARAQAQETGTMESMKRTFASILLVLSLSGCVDIDLHTRVGQDGSGVQHWQFTTTALLAGQIRQRIERDPLFRKKNAKISEQFKEGDFILTVEIPFGQVLELNANDHQVDFEKTGLFRKTYTYTKTS